VTEVCSDSRVAVAQLSSDSSPEVSYAENQLSTALSRVGQMLHLDQEGRGPFGRLIPRGARVLVKPNLVVHKNQGPWGLDPLVTHPSLIRATVEAILRAEPSEVLVGDAPIQSCDFDRLLSVTGLNAWTSALMNRDSRFKGIRDFRRTTCTFVDGVRVASENLQPEDRFSLFDLGRDSLLESISDDNGSFRVTCYDPNLMARTHAPGRHQYLVARDVLDSDVVVNLPKLKTHKKAGITCALKNLIGINGNKEYLPHHRIGGAKSGGDCYPGSSLIKRTLEYVWDQQNSAASFTSSRLWGRVARPFNGLLRLTGDRLGTEGSWSGNDTVWRTGLDLNRILLYGRSDGTLGQKPERRVIHLVDAVIAGQGDGPLSPQPLPMGLILAGRNAAAVDLVGARLLGYDPAMIPIVREAFGKFRWPLTSFLQDEVLMMGDWGEGLADQVLAARDIPGPAIHPAGWRDAAAHATSAGI
jgi:uncharacterized protein (DUF362 family)